MLKFKNDSMFADFLKVIAQAKNTLVKTELRKIKIIAATQFFLSLIDLISLGLIGVLATLTISGIARKSNPGIIEEALDWLSLNTFSIEKQVVILGVSSIVLIIFRSLSSLFLMKRIYYYLSLRGAKLSGQVMNKVVSSDLSRLKKYSSQDYIFYTTFGVESLYLRILAPYYSAISDFTLLAGFAILLFVIDPFSASSTVVMLLCILIILNLIQAKKIQLQSNISVKSDLKSRKNFSEILDSLRELRVHNRQEFVSKNFSQERELVANSIAYNNWIAYSNKYLVEGALLTGGMLISAFQFWLFDAVKAVSVLTLFLTASMRMAPAALRIQQSVVQARACLPAARGLLEMIDYLEKIALVDRKEEEERSHSKSFVPKILVNDLVIQYSNASKPTLDKITFTINPGEFIAIAGESGAGKSTLVDAILGLIPIVSGSVQVSDLPSSEVAATFPGKISYLPQNTFISDGTLRENLEFGYESGRFTLNQLKEALIKAELNDFVEYLNADSKFRLGERGANLSGGQKQRIGLARALLTDPKLLILDEATSALDDTTESKISKTIESLGNDITRVVIAHRLSSIKNADRILYLSNGKIKFLGSPDEYFKVL